MADTDVKTLSREALETEVLHLRARRQQARDTGREKGGRSVPADGDQLFAAIESASVPMILTDPHQPDEPIILANQAFQDLSGYSAEQLMGRNCRFLQGPDTDPAQVERIREALRTKQDITVDILNYRADGTPFLNELYISPVLGPDGEVLYHFGSQIDVTEHYEDRQALAASERRLRAVFDSSSDFAIVVTDREGCITDWNTGAEAVLGWSAADMRGRNAERFFTPEDRANGQITTEMNSALQTGRASDERWHLRKDGERFWASGEMVPLRDADDAHVGFVKILRDRTEEHLAGKALRETETRLRDSEERLRLVIEGAMDHAILTIDPAGIITSWSAGAETTFGYAAGEVIGQPTEIIFVPEDRAAGAPAQELAKARQTGCSNDERWHLTKDGTRVFMNGSVHPLPPDAQGQERGFLKIARNETERRRAEEVLRHSEERFRTILDTIEAAFAIVEVKFDADDRPVDYRFIEANPAFERQAGVNLRGKWVTEFAPDLERFWFDTYGRVAKTGEPATFENYAEAFKRWFDVRAVRVGAPKDRKIAIFFSDVTERRAAEERLRASEASARRNIERVQLALGAGAIIGTWFWDLPNDQFTVDEAFARAFGLDPALGREGIPLAQIVATVHPDDQAGLADAISEAIARGGGYAHQYRVRRHDGHYYWLEANGHVEHAADGTPLRFPGVLIDVEERRTIEAERDRALAQLRALTDTLEQRVQERSTELMRAEEALRQSQKMEAVGQLTGGVAHDFNNLLTIIRSSVDFLRRPELPEARKGRYLDAVSETVDRAAKLTGQLLAFARRQALKPEVFDVSARLRGVGDMLDTVTGSRIHVIIEVPDQPCFIRADVSQFETALVNMAVNARDAMDGEGRLTLRVDCAAPMPAIRGHAASESDFAAVSVSDTGTGIAAEQLGRIFEPFFTTKEVGKGTGLGLSQVFGFAKQSGGDVDVYSALGEGTTFTLYLPEIQVERPNAAADNDDQALAPIGAGQRVLVVEDNIEVGRFCTQILDDLGYQTEWAANAEEALVKVGADGNGFDAVFSDVVMPGMGGVALAQTLRQQLPGLPVILASGYSHVLAQENDHGFELLHKPYSAEQLGRVLQRVLSRPAAPRAAETVAR